MSKRIDSLLDRIDDPALRADMLEEITELLGDRKVGLVFEPHLPETVMLRHVSPRRGLRVRLKEQGDDGELMSVLRVRGGQAICAPARPPKKGEERENGEVLTVPTDDLVVVAEFGDPIYPGLREISRVLGPGADPSAPQHVVLNAENHHALQALQWSHAGAVDCIYIDPPYNTGGKSSWLYNDSFVDNSDREKSSKWLSFMERRLKLARDLLKPSGVIFVSIGDDEQHRLRMLMDQVFDRTNFVANLAVEMSTTSGPKTTNAQQGTIVKNVEYVLIYRKGAAFDDVAHTPLLDGVDSYDTHYSVWLNDDGSVSNLGDAMLADPDLKTEITNLGLLGRGEAFSVSNMDKLLNASDLAQAFLNENLSKIARVDRAPVSAKHIKPAAGRWVVFQAPDRTYLLTTLSNGNLQQLMPLSLNFRMSDDYRPRFGRTVIRGDLWRGFHQDMGNVAKEGAVAFNNGKKPTRLIKQLIRWANNSPDAVILDFFGGSGTTTHAVMEMNAEDGGRRQSVLVTNNEVGLADAKTLHALGHHPGEPAWESKGVFEAVTQPRITTVLTGIREDGSRYSDGLPETVAFYELTYLDPERVKIDAAFTSVAPLLWLRAGGVGPVIADRSPHGFSVTERYGVLHDVDDWQAFAEALPDSATTAFIVTDSPSSFATAADALPSHLTKVRLYEKYIRTFEINTGERAPR